MIICSQYIIYVVLEPDNTKSRLKRGEIQMRLKKEMKSILSDRKTAHQNGLKPSGHERTCLDERVICAPEFLHATKNEASSNCPLSDKNLFCDCQYRNQHPS